MKNTIPKSMRWKILSYSLIGFFVIISGIFTSPINHYVTSLSLILFAVAAYFFIVLVIAGKNWMDVRAVFTGVWFATLGLASLRLAEYQEQWQNKTWLLSGVGYFMFQVGTNLGIYYVSAWFQKVEEKLSNIKRGRIRLSLQKNRLYSVCVITTLVGLTCFVINVLIRGYIPCFSDDVKAYNNFYTKFHLFAVAATSVSGLCYYCIKCEPIGIVKKLILWLCIFYLVFLFPTMVVSRGVFVVAAVSLTVVVYYLNKKRLLVLIACVAMIFGVYQLTSELRNYADWQLNTFFEPKEIVLDNPKQEDPDAVDSTLEGENSQEQKDPDEIIDGQDQTDLDAVDPTLQSENPQEQSTDEGNEAKATFKLSPKLSFLYGYLTVSHDNFNEAVKNAKEYTWGLRQLAPFNVILRQKWLDTALEEAEYYQVNPYLNTTNMLGVFYYDFREIGVAVCMLLWAIVFGVMQSFYENRKGPFSLLVMGNGMIPVALCFFSTWVNKFELWMFWGCALIFALVSCVVIEPRKQKD